MTDDSEEQRQQVPEIVMRSYEIQQPFFCYRKKTLSRRFH